VTADAAPPQLSPDGHWWWTGAEWVPAAQRYAPVVPPEPTHAVQPVEQPFIPVQQLSPVFEILPATAAVPIPVRKRSRLLTAIAGSAVTAVVIAGGAAYGVGHYLGGGGQQPEDVLPANAMAVVKLDLDPSIAQKAALFRLSRAFPQLHAKNQDSLKDDLLRAMFTSDSMDYDHDIKPWLGDRVAVAVVPDSSEDGFAAVGAVQYTNKDKAKRVLLDASARAATGDNPFFFAFSGDYALIADTQAQADRYAASAAHLSDDSGYQRAVDSLGGDQIAIAWADVKGVYNAVKAHQSANPLWAKVKVAPTGAFIVGAHAASNYLEVQGKAVGITQGLTQAGAGQLGKVRTANLVSSFPNDTFVAMEATGLGDVVTNAFSALPPPIAQAAAGLGLGAPSELGAVLGTDAAVGLTGDLSTPTVIAHVRTPNPARAVAALTRVGKLMRVDMPWCPCDGPPLTVRRDKTGYVVSSDPHAPTTGKLGSTASFKRAVPDAKTAGMLLYVNLGKLPRSVLPGVENLDAVGMSVNGATGEFRLRLTTR
jgi:hypothetical protein